MSSSTVYKKVVNEIGPHKALIICRQLGISIYTKLTNLSTEKGDNLTKLLLVGGFKKEQVENNIQRLIKVGSYRGSRHKLGYPVRGQRTRSNAKTSKLLRFNTKIKN